MPVPSYALLMASQPLSVVSAGRKRRGPTSLTEQGSPGSGEPRPPARPRPRLTDSDERDDARQVLTILLAATQRERARADQFYTRARNLLAYTTALFTAVQVAFLTGLGRTTSGGAALITTTERATAAGAALIGLLALIVGVFVLFGFADRGRSLDTVSGDDLLETWLDPRDEESAVSLLEALNGKVAAEEESWAKANRKREKLNRWLAGIAGFAAIVTLAELIILYLALA